MSNVLQFKRPESKSKVELKSESTHRIVYIIQKGEILVSGPLDMVIEYFDTRVDDLPSTRFMIDQLIRQEGHNTAILGALGHFLFTEFRKVS